MRFPLISRTRYRLFGLAASLALWSAAAGVASPAAAAAQPAARPQTKPAPKAPRSSPRTAKAAAAVAAPALILPEADAAQLDAAERVYYGHYDCEFNQSITLHSNPKHLAYVDLTHGKSNYLMKPVLSSTGAIRLEDVMGATLMVQISAKSMLLDVKGGKRLVDDCITPKQRELVEAARQAKAAAALEASQAASQEASQEAARSAAAPASAPVN